jgi:sugar phosphate isomerase/epimerase
MGLLLLNELQAGTVSMGKKRKKIITGAHVWVYASTLPERNVSPILDRIFSDVSYAGFDGVETMEHPLRGEAYTGQFRELTEKYNIQLIGTSYTGIGAMWDKEKHNQIYEDADLVLTNLASAGGKTFGVTVGQPAGRQKTATEFDNQAFILRRIIALCRKKGVVLNLHNHTVEVENNLFQLRETLKRVPEVKLGPDLNWLLRAGGNPVDFLREFRKQIVFLHLRDQLSDGKWPESMGEGDVDFKQIADVLKEINFKGEAVIELAHERGFVPTRPIRESLKMSRDYMRKTMGI